MPIVIIGVIGGLAAAYAGANILVNVGIALLAITTAGILGVVGYKLFNNTKNNCDLFSMKKCK